MERRVEITGPANSTKMVIQMLNGTPEARADMAMLDFEDSMKPTWTNVIDAVHNVIGAAKGAAFYRRITCSAARTPRISWSVSGDSI